MSEKFSRRDFLKVAGWGALGTLLPIPDWPEGVSNSNFDTFTSRLGENGLTMILNKDTNTFYIFDGQPSKIQVGGDEYIQVNGQSIVENYLLVPSNEVPMKQKGVKKSAYLINGVLIYSSLLARGVIGTESYTENREAKQKLIDASPDKFVLPDSQGNLVSGLLGNAKIEVARTWNNTAKYANVRVTSNDGKVTRLFRMYPALPQETQPNEKFIKSTGKASFLIKAIPTAPSTPEAPQPVDENDLSIIESSVHPIDIEFMGTQITGTLKTDESLSRSNPSITDISLPEKVAAEYFARSIYKAWEKDHPGETFETYMQWISEVQAGKRDPMDIAFAAFANNLNDGKPYKNGQEKYLFVPWYNGPVPAESSGFKVRPVSEMGIIFVRGGKVSNITITGKDFGDGFGVNLNKTTLNFYIGLIYGAYGNSRSPMLVSEIMAVLPWWLINNTGNDLQYNVPPYDKQLYNFLLNNGLSVYPPKP